jgi:hypothetical protein
MLEVEEEVVTVDVEVVLITVAMGTGVEAEVVIFYKELLNMSMIESKMFFVNNECSNPDSVKVGVPKRYVLIPFFF